MSIADGVTAPDPTPTDLPPTEVVVDPPVPSEAEAQAAKEQASVAAFREGVTKAKPDEADKIPSAPKDAADVAATAAAAVVAPVDPKAVLADPAATPEARAKAEDDAEAADMGLRTQKANARFRELKGQIREAEPFQAVLKERNITDPKLLVDALDTMQRTVEWEQTIMESTATPEQFSSALNVIRAMNGDDPKLLKVCYDELLNQAKLVGQRIGIVGEPDSLESYAAHPDIQAALADGSITPAYAAELVQQRAAQALRDSTQQREVQTRTQTAAQQEAARAEEQAARAGIDELSNELKANDPDFAAKLAILTPYLPAITQQFPPSQWVARIAQAYALTKLPPAAAPPRVRPGHMPLRPSQPAPAMQQEITRANAFRAGVAAVTEQA